jgi:hypothetical protein
VLVVKAIKGSPIFELMAAKRGGRIGWRAPDGETRVYSRFIAHSTVQGQLYWRDVDPSELPVAAGDSLERDQLIVLDLVPPEGEDIEKNQLLADCINNDLPKQRARDAIKRLIAAGKLREFDVARKGKPPKPPAVHVARVPQPATPAQPAPAEDAVASKKDEHSGVVVVSENSREQPPPPPERTPSLSS